MLAPRCRSLLAADISDVALGRAAERCAEHPNVTFRRLDIAAGALPGGFDLLFCSEVLYYVGGREDLPAVADRLAAALAPGGLLVTSHSNALVDDPDEPGFDWDVPYGARAINEALTACPRLQPVRDLRASHYRVSSYRRVDGPGTPERPIDPEPIRAAEMPAAVARGAHAGDGSVVVEAAAAAPPSTAALPILMYHRVDRSGDRWSVSPSAFEAQMAYLAGAGYRTVGLDDWRRAVERRVPLPGRAVVLTFDDGYRDFAEHAWPVLQRHGLRATVFVVTDRVGGVNGWDEGHEREHALLDWDEIGELNRAGVQFGAHTATHPHLMACTPAEVASEAARSRLALTERLGSAPTAFAYPFGDHDAVVAHLVGACGFAYGVTIRSALATRHDNLLLLPRIEATGESMARFVASLAPGETALASRPA